MVIYMNTHHTTPQVYETNGGTYVLALGNAAWIAPWAVSDSTDYREAVVGWASGEWEPCDSDGWERVSTHWIAELEAQAEDTAPGEWSRPATVFGEAVEYASTLAAHAASTEALRAAVLEAVEAGMSESEAARRSGVTRMTIRAWLNR